MKSTVFDLLAKRDDGTLSTDERIQLLKALKSDPEARETLRMHYMIAAGTRRLADAAGRTKPHPKHLVFPARSRWIPVLAAAASLLIVAGLWLWTDPRQDSASLASIQIGRIEGHMLVSRRGDTLVGKQGMVLQAGDKITIPSTTNAVFHLQEGSASTARLTLSDDAQLVLEASASTLSLTLAKGRIDASVSPRSPGRPMLIETPCATLEVLGTRFIATANEAATRARVLDGSIAMIRRSDSTKQLIEAGYYAVATTGYGTLPYGPYSPGMNVEGRLVFRETFEQWNPEIWYAAYFDKVKPHRFSEDPWGRSVDITSTTHGHPAVSQVLDIRADGPTGSRTTVYASAPDLHFPERFVMEFDIFHERPSNITYIETGGIGTRLYDNPRATAMRTEAMRNKQWFRARIETQLYQTENGLWNAEQHEYMNGTKISHRHFIAIRHPESYSKPLFLFFALNSGHVNIANIAVHEWSPFDSKPTPPNPIIFRESFEDGWSPHIWQTTLFNPKNNTTQIQDVFGSLVSITTDTHDPDRPQALEIKSFLDNHTVLRVNPNLILLPDRFVVTFDTFYRSPSVLGYLDIGGETKHQLNQSRQRARILDNARKAQRWVPTRLEIELTQGADGTRIADVKEYLHGELTTHKVIVGGRDPRSAIPPDILLFALESGHVLIDNIRAYEWPEDYDTRSTL